MNCPKGACFGILLILLCAAPPFIPFDTVRAGCPPPATGDWNIINDTVVKDLVIVLSGNLTISTSGKLTMTNCTLIVNSTASNTFHILVDGNLFQQGRFDVTYSVICAMNASCPYNFTVNGRMTMSGCTVKDLKGSMNINDPTSSLGGIQIGSSSVTIQDTNITDYQSIGISVMPYASPTIRRCNISQEINLTNLAFTVGILDLSMGISSPTYSDNMFSGNIIAGIASAGLPMLNMFATISYNKFVSNGAGVICFGTSPDITGNTFDMNLGGVALIGSSSEVSGNTITGAGSAVTAMNSGTPSIHDNVINASALAGVFLYNGTDAKVYDNTISQGFVYGINAQACDAEIYQNDISANIFAGISLTDSNAYIHNNDIGAVLRGIEIMNESVPRVISNTISGLLFTTGIYLSGNRSLTPDIEANAITVLDNSICIDVQGYSPNIIGNSLTLGAGSTGINVTDSSPLMEKNTCLGQADAIGLRLLSSSFLAVNNTLSGGALGIFAMNCTPSLDANKFVQNSELGAKLVRCKDVILRKNTFDRVAGNGVGSHMSMEADIINSTNVQADLALSYIRLLNTTYNATGAKLDAGAKLQLDWFLDILVQDKNSNSISGASLSLINNTGVNRYSLASDANGRSLWNIITQRTHVGPGIDAHAPYLCKAQASGLKGAATTELDASTSMIITLWPELGPSLPYNFSPQLTHNPQPLLKWNNSVDLNGDTIYYLLSIGTSSGSKQILKDANMTETHYQLPGPLQYRKHYITISAHTLDGNTSGDASFIMDIFDTPPVLASVGDRTVYLDVDPHLNMTLNASDSDTGPVDVLSFHDDTTLFNANSTTGAINWTATQADVGVHIVNLSVSDGCGGSDWEVVKLTVGYKNLKPVANAGPDISVELNSSVSLNANGSFDPDGTVVEYLWTTPDGISLDLNDPVRPRFLAEIIGNITFILIVRDDNDTLSNPDSVMVQVLPEVYNHTLPHPEVILSECSVTPQTGMMKDTFVYSVDVLGLNVTSKQAADVNATGFIRFLVDGSRYFDAQRLALNSTLEGGMTFTCSVQGYVLGLGNHTFKTVCQFENTTGPVSASSGPWVKANESVPFPDDDDNDAGDDDNDTGSTSLLWILILIIVILILAIGIAIAIFILLRKPHDEPKEEPVKENADKKPEKPAGKVKSKIKKKSKGESRKVAKPEPGPEPGASIPAKGEMMTLPTPDSDTPLNDEMEWDDTPGTDDDTGPREDTPAEDDLEELEEIPEGGSHRPENDDGKKALDDEPEFMDD